MIGIVDYGIGNIQALLNIYKKLNLPACAASSSEAIEEADRLILPGVGAFDWAMETFNASGLREPVTQAVQQRNIPVLGICVGMQMLAYRSEEGRLEGLGWIVGEVKKFAAHADLPLPHMGWNEVEPVTQEGLFAGLKENARFYFLHSYYFAPDRDEDVLARTDYGGPFVSAVGSGHVYGVQFHPEKSHGAGVRLWRNFAEA